MRTMYPSQVNSSSTKLSMAINDTEVSITVDDGSVLPDAPNTLTIGYDRTTPETVLMTAKTGNVLTIERGFDGSASSWGTGIKIARIFSSYDYEAFRTNINSLDTYTHSQVGVATIWTVTHNLNRYPSVTVVDSADNTVIGEVQYTTLNELTVIFSGGFSGKAYLN